MDVSVWALLPGLRSAARGIYPQVLRKGWLIPVSHLCLCVCEQENLSDAVDRLLILEQLVAPAQFSILNEQTLEITWNFYSCFSSTCSDIFLLRSCDLPHNTLFTHCNGTSTHNKLKKKKDTTKEKNGFFITPKLRGLWLIDIRKIHSRRGVYLRPSRKIQVKTEQVIFIVFSFRSPVISLTKISAQKDFTCMSISSLNQFFRPFYISPSWFRFYK